ncbi:hypothetical protein AOC36_03215 [Erysipelothrix larvae]|uniref:TrpR-related protein YerC/YecD n=1 Tax=Erysipelothrix larvae TaxID=1514105 RepID=A0A0X8GZ01_9FIRM|nr:hypothetical protein AOC36_03215 [Erysipelothrix larvae]
MHVEHKRLYDTILKLKDLQQAEAFFKDLCTEKELKDFSDRLEVAEKLLEGKTYDQISKETSASSATIARVNRAIMYGKGGYKSVIQNDS